MKSRNGAARPGFVLPLALFLLMAMGLVAALVTQGALHELHTARGDFAAARAQTAAGSALADLLASRPDSALLTLRPGLVSASVASSGADTTSVSLQSLGNGILRVTAATRSWAGGIRGDAAFVGIARVVPDPQGPPGSLRYRRLPGWWWTQLP